MQRAGVPVVSNGRTAGVLTFYSTFPNAFNEDHRRLVEAAQAGPWPAACESGRLPAGPESDVRGGTLTLQSRIGAKVNGHIKFPSRCGATGQ